MTFLVLSTDFITDFEEFSSKNIKNLINAEIIKILPILMLPEHFNADIAKSYWMIKIISLFYGFWQILDEER